METVRIFRNWSFVLFYKLKGKLFIIYTLFDANAIFILLMEINTPCYGYNDKK